MNAIIKIYEAQYINIICRLCFSLKNTLSYVVSIFRIGLLNSTLFQTGFGETLIFKILLHTYTRFI